MTDFQIIDPTPAPGSEDRRLAAFTPRPTLPLPSPGIDFDIRSGTHTDIPWIDELRAAAKNSLGFASFGELEGHLKKGNVYVAVTPAPGSPDSEDHSSGGGSERRIGYCIAANRYYQRDEVGQIYQMNIAPGSRRKHVAANLLKKVWETWPAGVKLCGCWCAQDLDEANGYWEKCGFTAVAFRAGSRTRVKGEPGVHIYWQKRITAGDGMDLSSGASGGTPFWYPKQTSGGAMKEARIVFPVPPGSSWKDAKPAVYPGIDELFEKIAAEREAKEKQMLLQLAPPEALGSGQRETKAEREAAKADREARRKRAAERSKTAAGHGGLRIGWNAGTIERVPTEQEVAAKALEAKAKLREAKKQMRAEAKKAAKAMSSVNDPILVAAARDLRDRWMEAVQREPALLAAPSGGGGAGFRGYDVSRQLEDATPVVKKVENASGGKRLAA